MPTAFTVDRKGSLQVGAKLVRTRHTDIQPTSLQAHVDDLFPAGVTEHGNGYLLNAKQPAQDVSGAIELIFEYVRRARFPHAPSRFESIFAFESLPEARHFMRVFGSETGMIWEVEFDTPVFRADMACLSVCGSVLETSWRADRYWSSLDNGSGVASLWELLLEPPIHVRRIVEAYRVPDGDPVL